MIDYDELKNKIIVASEAAYTKTIQDYPERDFYGFALYTSREYGCIYPTFFSEQGLDEIVEKDSRQTGPFSTLSVEQSRMLSRWSPCDSPHHLEHDDEFSHFQDVFFQVEQEMDVRYDAIEEADEAVMAAQEAAIDEMADQHVEKLHHCFIEALKALDKKEMFGSGKQRNQMLINLLMGDQSDEERIDNASLLNSPVQATRYAKELELSANIWDESMRSLSRLSE